MHRNALTFSFFFYHLKVSGILKKAANERTTEEIDILAKSPELTLRLQKLAKKRDAAKSRHLEVKLYPMNKNDYSYRNCKWYASSKTNLNELFDFLMHLLLYVLKRGK